MEILMYITVAIVVFNFLMFLGMNSRIGHMEIILANHQLQWATQIEFNKGVTDYHTELDTWLEKTEKELEVVKEIVEKRETQYVEGASKR